MNDLVLIALAAALCLWVLLIWWNEVLLKSSIVLTIILIFCSGYAQTILPVRFLLAACAILTVFHVLIAHRTRIQKATSQTIIFWASLCFLIFAIGQFIVENQQLDPLFRYTVLFPLMLLAGLALSKSGHGDLAVTTIVYVSLCMACLAGIERLRGSFFVAGSYDNADRLVRDGSIRSIVFSEHPLVLSVLLVAAVPFVRSVFRTRPARFLAYCILVSGIVSTNSRGALTLVIVWFLVAVASQMRLLRGRASAALRFFAFLGAAVGLVTLFTGSSSGTLASTSAVEASAEYRSSLYFFAIRSLTERPFGWGLSGLPEGVYVAASYFGPLDISRTVDSEIALIMFDFGWLGLFALLYLLGIMSKRDRLVTPVGQSALLVTASGFYLALHSWSGLGSAWFYLIGLLLGSTLLRSAQDEPPSTSVGADQRAKNEADQPTGI